MLYGVISLWGHIHVALERTLGSSVQCPKETPYSSEVRPRGHTALGYSVQEDNFRGGHVCDTMTTPPITFIATLLTTDMFSKHTLTAGGYENVSDPPFRRR